MPPEVDDEADEPDRAALPLRGQLELEVSDDEASVRAAPVLGAPVVSVVTRGQLVDGEIEVLGEPSGGDPRWYLVRDGSTSPAARGFVHSSLVRERP